MNEISKQECSLRFFTIGLKHWIKHGLKKNMEHKHSANEYSKQSNQLLKSLVLTSIALILFAGAAVTATNIMDKSQVFTDLDTGTQTVSWLAIITCGIIVFIIFKIVTSCFLKGKFFCKDMCNLGQNISQGLINP